MRRWQKHLASCGAVVTTALMGWLARGALDASATSETIPYRGYLEIDGIAQDATVDLGLSLWDASTGGSMLWQETQHAAPIIGGQFAVSLGAETPLTDAVGEARSLYLQIDIRPSGSTSAFETLSGRQALGAVPFALAASRGARGQTFVVDDLKVDGNANVSGEVSGAGSSKMWAATSTGSVHPAFAGLTVIPGLSVTLELERPARLQLLATGTIRLANQSSGNCQVALAFVVNGARRGDPNHGEALHQVRYVSPTLHQPWAISRSEGLSPGTYIIEVAADDQTSGCYVCAEFDGSLTEYTRCHLSVMAFYE